MKHKSFYGLGLATLLFVIVAAKPEGKPVNPHSQNPLPAWDQKLPAETRFVVLRDFDGAAVLDRETGLVWEKSPSGGTQHFSWLQASEYCATLKVSNRMGWRLPTIQELLTLVDPAVTTSPTLPSGSPFQNVQPTYWSATTHPELSRTARVASFMPDLAMTNGDKAGKGYAWCVRGGSGPDMQ